MAKLNRETHKQFGSVGTSDNFAQYGSTVGPGVTYTKDIAAIQAPSAWTNGWQSAVYPTNSAPFMEEMNAWCYEHSYQVAYMLQEGIPEWNSGTSYFIGSIVKKAGTFELYGSLINDNLGNALPSQVSNANWEYLNPSIKNPPGTVIESMAINPPAGTLRANGQAVSRVTYVGLFTASTIQTTGNTNLNNPIVTNIPDTSLMAAGMPICGPAIPSGTTIFSVDTGNQITLSQGASATQVGSYLNVCPFGVGDGSTTFNVVNKSGVTGIGTGTGAGLTLRTLGKIVGEETHLLTIPEIPSHTHTYIAATGGYYQGATPPSTLTQATPGTASGATGGGGSHNNMQPSIGMNYYVYF